MSNKDYSAPNGKRMLLKAILIDVNAIKTIYNDMYGEMNTLVLYLLIIMMILTFPLNISTYFFARELTLAVSLSLILFLIIRRDIFSLLRIHISILPLPLSIELFFVIALSNTILYPLTRVAVTNLFGVQLIFPLSLSLFDFYFFIFGLQCAIHDVYKGIDQKSLVFKYILTIGVFSIGIILANFLLWLFNPFFLAFAVVIILCLFAMISMI